MINEDVDGKKNKLTYKTIVSHILSRITIHVTNPYPHRVQKSKIKVMLMFGAQTFTKVAKNGNKLQVM